jgi:hypothetical protein
VLKAQKNSKGASVVIKRLLKPTNKTEANTQAAVTPAAVLHSRLPMKKRIPAVALYKSGAPILTAASLCPNRLVNNAMIHATMGGFE